MPIRRAAAMVAVCLASCAAQADPAATTSRDTDLTFPVTDGAGQTTALHARVCRPATDSPAPLVVVAHGSPADERDRPTLRLTRCGSEAAQWFLTRGYAVAFALRRGYGETGGPWAENYGGCSRADYEGAGRETARDIAAVVDGATRFPFIRPDGVVVVGQSAGGWGAIAYDSQPHPRVAAFVVMAGGRGGHQDGLDNHNCQPDRLAAAASHYGATATTPMLWIYAANDSYFAPAMAQAMVQAFTAAGGQAVLEQPGPFGRDGHRLFFGRGGAAIWGPMVERYLAQQHA